MEVKECLSAKNPYAGLFECSECTIYSAGPSNFSPSQSSTATLPVFLPAGPLKSTLSISIPATITAIQTLLPQAPIVTKGEKKKGKKRQSPETSDGEQIAAHKRK